MSSVGAQIGDKQGYNEAAVRFYGAAILSALGLLSACVQYRPEPLDLKLGAGEFAARRLTDLRVRDEVARLLPQAASAWPLKDWDRAELLAVALAQNPQLAVARARVAAAVAHEIRAAEPLNPDLTLQSEYARHDAHPWLYGFSLNWLLRSGERRRSGNRLAGLETDNMRLQQMDQAWALRRALSTALSDWESARRRRNLLDTLAAAQDRLLAFVQQRVSAGEDAPVELIVSRQARIQVDEQQAETRESAEAAQVAAAKVLGLPPQALDGVSLAWPDWGGPPPVDDDTERQKREQALLSRADLGFAIGEYAQAEIKLRQAIARQYPQFVVQPGYYWDHGIAKFPFDVGFTLPLNRNHGEIAEARSEREVAGRRMMAVQEEIYGDIAAAERAEANARASAATAEQQLESAQRQKQQVELGLRVGAADRQAQLGADIIVMRAELEVLERRARLQNSRNSLEDALHSPLSGPELALAERLSSIPAGAGP